MLLVMGVSIKKGYKGDMWFVVEEVTSPATPTQSAKTRWYIVGIYYSYKKALSYVK